MEKRLLIYLDDVLIKKYYVKPKHTHSHIVSDLKNKYSEHDIEFFNPVTGEYVWPYNFNDLPKDSYIEIHSPDYGKIEDGS